MTTPPLPAGPTDAPAPYEPGPLPLAREWPGVTADWRVPGRDGSAVLEAALRFRLDAVVPGAVTGGEPTTAQRDAAMLALARFDTIHDEVLDPAVQLRLCTSLAPADPLPVEHERLVAFVEDARIVLSLFVRGEPVPEATLAMPVELEVTSAMLASQDRDLFPADVTLELARRDDAGGGASDGVQVLHIIEATPSLTPRTAAADAVPDSQEASGDTLLERFARDFEDAFGGHLKMARELGDAGRPPRPWCLRVGKGGVTFGDAGSARWFAVPPLAPSLVDAEGLAETGTVRFSAIDLDEQAARLLDCVDLCLARGAVGAIESQAPDLCTRLVDVKARLADAVAARVVPMSADERADNALAAARETLHAALMESLAAANAARAVAQLPLPVQRAHADGGVTRLVGRLVSDAPHAGLTGRCRLPLPPGGNHAGKDSESSVGVVLVPPPGLDRTHLPALLRFEATAVEHVRGQGGDASLTLPFIVTTTPGGEPDPALTIALGSLDIPLPNRRAPVAPAIIAQRAAGGEGSASIAEARRWTRSVTVSAPLTAHDVLRVMMRHAPATEAIHDRPGARHPLADALAPFMAEEEDLMLRIERLVAGEPDDAERSAALSALDRLAALAEGVAARWAELPPAAMPPHVARAEGAPEELHVYELAFGDDADASAAGAAMPPSHDSRRLLVRRWRAASGWPGWPVIDGWTRELPPALPPIWPDVAADERDGASEVVRQDAWYQRDPAARDAWSNDRWTLAFGGLDVLLHRNADISVQVTRNAVNALNAGGAPATGAATSAAFRMESERSSVPGSVPLLEIGPMSIDDLPGGTLPEVLGALCAALVAPEDESLALSVGARYSYALSPRAAGPDDMRVAVPLLLARDLSIGIADADWRDPASVASQLAARMAAWFRASRPSTAKGRIELELSLLDGDPPRPLLHFQSLERGLPTDDAWWGAGP